MENNDKEFKNGENEETNNDINKDEINGVNELKEDIHNIVNEEVIGVKEVIEKPEKKKIKGGLLQRIMAGVIDQSINLLLSLAILFVFDIVIRFIGFYIADRVLFYFIVYVVVNILYRPILKSTKLKRTFGEKALNI